jgi:two-component system heavy metal sensor histidine kinase CusS
MSAGARPYSIGRRLSWLFAALTLLGFGVLSAVIYVVAASNLAQKADVELARKIELVRHLVEEASSSGDVAAMRHKLGEFFMGHSDLQVTLYLADGRVAYQTPGRLHEESNKSTTTVKLGAETQGVTSARIDLDRSADAMLLTSLAALLTATTLVGAACVSVSGFWLVRRSLAPLRDLATQTSALHIDRLGQRLFVKPEVAELQPWIRQFNELLGRLDYAYRQMEAFNADVAHELRTPLATLISQMEFLLARPRTVEELRDTLGSGLEEVRRLTTIVNDMLFLAHADQGAQVRMANPSSLADEVRQVMDFHEGVLSERDLTPRIEGDALVAFESGLIRRAISNILANAARYADPGTQITISIRREDALVWLEVTNCGAEVPPASLPHIFDRFFRMEAAREHSDTNHGLGLAIVAAIARMHGGRTVARSTPGRTTIGFSLAAVAAIPSAPVEAGLGHS